MNSSIPDSARPRSLPTRVSVVVPLFNEAESIQPLYRRLIDLRQDSAESYGFEFILVDDGSTDETWDGLEEVFSDVSECQLIRLQENRGVAGAILAGIRAAPCEIVCSFDADLTYDPGILVDMIPLIEEADLVTASPYHPRGTVVNVPRWRLFLSRNLSRIYNYRQPQSLFTYTSCCRVYRKSVVEKIELSRTGFIGVAELVLRLQRQGCRIVEFPATLGTRALGVSKMNTMKTILGHVRLFYDLGLNRGRPVPDRPISREQEN